MSKFSTIVLTQEGGTSPSNDEAVIDFEEEEITEDDHTAPTRPHQHHSSFASNICCVSKQYFTDYTNLVDSLHIIPRLIVQKKNFRTNVSYGLTLSIRNNALYPRRVIISTDSPVDTEIIIKQPDINCFIDTDEILPVKINIRAITEKEINRTRHIFIRCFHPNITFQVPIIVLKNLKGPIVCDYISLPPTVPPDRTYFEMLLFNPSKDPVSVKFRSSFMGITLNHLNKNTILAEDYVKLLVIFDPKKLQVYRGIFNVKFGLSPSQIVVFEYVPKSMSVFINRSFICFGQTKLGSSVERSVTICNESPHEVTISTSFYAHTSTGESSNSVDSISIHSALMYNLDEDAPDKEIAFNENAFVHFDVNLPRSLNAHSSNQVTLKFHPLDTEVFPDEMKPPFIQRTKLCFCFTDDSDCIESHSVILHGEISGIVVETFPKVIDFRKIYLGEEHCAFIKVLNVDSVVAKVRYVDSSDNSGFGLRVMPVEGIALETCERGDFHVSFFTIIPGQFLVTLRFKVQNGHYFSIAIKGIGQNIQLRTFPQLAEFGTVPFGVPQKRFMLVMNPLAVPITMQVTPTDDGAEMPLVFNIRDATEMLPISIKDPIKQLQKVHDDLRDDTAIPDTHIEINNEDAEILSRKSVSSTQSEYSRQFEEDIMNPIPEMATHILKNLKKSRILDKPETDKRVIQEALNSLLNLNYFSVMKKHNNFIFLDWNAIPSDPTEVYCDNEIIYLRPNTGRSITILIIPNRVGYFHRSLTVRICPTMAVDSSESTDEQPPKTFIESEFLCSKLWIEYNCCTPKIEWDNIVNLNDRIVYAGEEYDFDMDFQNGSEVSGFIHFDVIPNEMSFRDGNWKFYVAINSIVTAKLSVVFRVLGANKLSGLLRIVGDSRPYPFHVMANVLPTKINISVKSIYVYLPVYEYHRMHVYIDNVSPTQTMLSMKLKHIQFQRLSTRGCKLSPKGQSMYTTLMSMFTDPDVYQNMLYIDLKFENSIEIPITFVVTGLPIYFDPDIKDGFDAGLLLTDTQQNFIENKYIFQAPVKVTNKGLRSYRLNVTRLNTYNSDAQSSKCDSQPLSARFDMQPRMFEAEPQSVHSLDILATSFEMGTFYSNFLITVTDLTHPQRKTLMRITVRAQFVHSQLTWDRKQLTFQFQPHYPLRERPQWLTAELSSLINVPLKNVELEVMGPFRIKELYEHSFEKHILVSFGPMEQKKIIVGLNKSNMRQSVCKIIDGRINVFAMGRMHKHLNLSLSVLVPELHIVHCEMVLFDHGKPFDHSVAIVNAGCADAQFKWRRIDESDTFIGAYDDPDDAVADLLSEILRTLEYNFTCDHEPNLSLRYQQCKCQFRREREIDNLIFEIIDDIINELDLGHRRFHIALEALEDSHDKSEQYSSSSYIHNTIDNILDRLKIETSEELSEPSSEYCYLDRFIYFYEKVGHVPKEANADCLLHLPHIRRSHEVKATFQLDVVGGNSKYLTVTLVNLPRLITYIKDNVYLNIKPWCETFNTVIRLTNVTHYPLQLALIEPEHPERRLIDGYAKIMQDAEMCMEPQDYGTIKVSGILGFNENFQRVFRVLINKSAISTFRLRGQGIMPILNITTPLTPVEQSLSDIIEEYEFMRKIFNYEIFKSITEMDIVEPTVADEEGEGKMSGSADFTELSETDEEMSSERLRYHEIQFFHIVQTYVLVNNNQELPNAVVLNQMLVTERYLHRLRINPELYRTHQKVYQSYLAETKPHGYKLPIAVSHFTVQPLPCEQLAYVLNLGHLTRNSLRRFQLCMHFFGPGKLIAAARTAVRIPGLFVDFKIANHADKNFTFWAEKCKEPEFFNKKYRNMWERLMDAGEEPRLKHAHSFDFDKWDKHQRDTNPKDRHLITEYYNSLNLSVYPDHKHHFSLARVHTSYHSNFSGVDLCLVGYFKPQSKYYKLDQEVIDYLFIDLHMGPTMPILLRGVIKA